MNRDFLVEIGLIIANTLLQAMGVLLLGWPQGNLFLLLWFENLILTVMAVIRMTVYRNLPGGGVNKVVNTAATFFVFCMVHGVFSFSLARGNGMSLSLFSLGMPAVLLVVRYLVEAADELSANNRPTKFKQTYTVAYARLGMLHMAIILCSWLMSHGHGWGRGTIPWSKASLAVLLVIKAISEIGLVVSSAHPRQARLHVTSDMWPRACGLGP